MLGDGANNLKCSAPPYFLRWHFTYKRYQSAQRELDTHLIIPMKTTSPHPVTIKKVKYQNKWRWPGQTAEKKKSILRWREMRDGSIKLRESLGSMDVRGELYLYCPSMTVRV